MAKGPNWADLAKTGLQVGSLFGGPAGTAASVGLGAVGAVADKLYKTPYEQRLADRIKELEGRELGLTDEEMAIYRQSMNAPMIEARAADEAKRLAAIAGTDVTSGAFFRDVGEEERRQAADLAKTEAALLVENEKVKREQEKELDQLYALQEDQRADPTESMFALADEIEYQVVGKAEEAAMKEKMLQFLGNEGLDGTAKEKKERLGLFEYITGLGSKGGA